MQGDSLHREAQEPPSIPGAAGSAKVDGVRPFHGEGLLCQRQCDRADWSSRKQSLRFETSEKTRGGGFLGLRSCPLFRRRGWLI